MALTRNESCIHERKGVYDSCKFFSHGEKSMGLFANPGIDSCHSFWHQNSIRSFTGKMRMIY